MVPALLQTVTTSASPPRGQVPSTSQLHQHPCPDPTLPGRKPPLFLFASGVPRPFLVDVAFSLATQWPLPCLLLPERC